MSEPIIDPAGTDDVIATVLVDRPDVVAVLEEARQAAWAASDRRRLELARVRIAQLLGCGAELAASTPGVELDEVTADDVAGWPVSDLLDEVDRAALAYCEQWVVDVASMTDELVSPLRSALGDDGLATFTNAVMVIEQRMRLRQTWERLGLTGDTP
jgi:alkylhydroperoxidase family enzyme